MCTQSEAALENKLIDQLVSQGYEKVCIGDEAKLQIRDTSDDKAVILAEQEISFEELIALDHLTGIPLLEEFLENELLNTLLT